MMNYRLDVNLLNVTGKLLSSVPQLTVHIIHNLRKWFFSFSIAALHSTFLFLGTCQCGFFSTFVSITVFVLK